jgi:3-deoxy-D-manno-octulosonic acid (KDO) 8-phosphate synthase
MDKSLCIHCFNFKTMILTVYNMKHTSFGENEGLYKKVSEKGMLRVWFCDKGVNFNKTNYIIDGHVALQMRKKCTCRDLF